MQVITIIGLAENDGEYSFFGLTSWRHSQQQPYARHTSRLKSRAEQYWAWWLGGGDWYVWHAPDGLRARAATGLGCMQRDEKLGVIEASYASAIIGVLSPVSSHC